MDVRWFYKLVPNEDKKSLLDVYGTEEVVNKIVVSYETYQGYRRYTLVPSHVKLYHMMKSVQAIHRRFHEVVLPECAQKPRFDIDISKENLPEGVTDLPAFGQEVMDNCVIGIMKVFEETDVEFLPERNLAVFTSHDESKVSYHLIINGLIHATTREAGAFYQEVIKQIETKYHNFIDHGIYSRYHPLRIVWSCKLNSTRFKVFQPEYTLLGYKVKYQLPPARDKDHLNIIILEHSLVTFTSNCELLPIYEDPNSINGESAPINLHSGVLEESYQTLSEYTQKTMGSNPFTVKGVKGRFINLIRHKSSYCEVCDRIHDNMDPHMYIFGKRLYYHCRRAPRDKRVDLGEISHDNVLSMLNPIGLSWITNRLVAQHNVEPEEIKIQYTEYVEPEPEPVVEPQPQPVLELPQVNNLPFKSSSSPPDSNHLDIMAKLARTTRKPKPIFKPTEYDIVKLDEGWIPGASKSKVF